MESLVFFGVLGLLITAAAPALYALRMRMAQPAQLELWRVLHRRGLIETAQPDGLRVALRRCTICPSVDTCNRWLANGGAQHLEEFCPNARYVEKLERP